jgi:septal ring factor EnvC (AmiA/AmiB activator)
VTSSRFAHKLCVSGVSHCQLSAVQSSSRERAQQLQREVAAVKGELSEQQRLYSQLEGEHAQLQQELEQQTAASSSSGSQADKQSWEERVMALTDHLMQKTAQLDRVSAERTALSVQLDDARARNASLDKQLRQERERLQQQQQEEAHVVVNGEEATRGGGTRSRSAARRGVSQAVSALDRLGALTGLLLRRHSSVRIAFALYVFVVHAWVLFILFHLIGEMDSVGAAGGRDTAGLSPTVQSSLLLPSLRRDLGNG